MRLALVKPSPKDCQCFAFKRMMRSSDGDMFWQVLEMGSLSWGRSTEFRTIGFWLTSLWIAPFSKSG
jgi:hypothetical protein